MNGKQKFYTLLIAFQFVLVVIVYFSVNFIVTTLALPTTDAYAEAVGQGMWSIPIAIGIAVGMTGLGAGMAIKTTGTAAISTLTENESAFFKGFLVVALGEALAIYGLIIGILLWTKMPTIT